MKWLLNTVALALVLQAPAMVLAQGSLEGQVSSGKEGAMEGVLVSAKLKGSNVTTTVVSDDKGHYAFPAGRLAPGQYDVTIRAADYDLSAPTTVQLAAGKPGKLDLTLKPAADPISQLSNAEWLNSVPGTEKQREYMEDCVDCHTLERVFKSSHTSAEFLDLFAKMATFTPGSVPGAPQTIAGNSYRRSGTAAAKKSQADFLASVNLNGREGYFYQMKRMPRPKGRATHVVITEYDLPRSDAHPHDVMLDKAGTAWYVDFSKQYLGSIDPKTGKVTDYKMPEPKPGAPTGNLDIEADKDGNFWISMQHQTGVMKFDPRTKKMTHFPMPAEWQTSHGQQSFVSPMHSDVDGKVWTNNQDARSIYRIDLKTGKYEDFGKYLDAKSETMGTYGIPSDNDNNLYLLEFRSLVKGDALVAGSSIGFIDAKTKEYTVYPTPTAGARPRRGRVDEQNRLWFAEYLGNAIGLFDPKTKEIKEFKLPTKWSAPYDVMADRNGEVWAASMLTDQVNRLDPKTGEVTDYLMPRQSNLRRVYVDNTQTHPTLWVGSVHGASVIRVEPLD